MLGEDTGNAKIEKICDALWKETVEPAKEEAKQIVNEAKAEATRRVDKARAEAAEILKKARQTAEDEKCKLHSALKLACSQAVEQVRQDLMHSLFRKTLKEEVSNASKDGVVISGLINALIASVERSGIKSRLEAHIASAGVSAKEVNEKLGATILDKLQEKSVLISDRLTGGVRLKLVDEKMTLDFSDDALVEALSNYVQEEFRALFFN